MKQICYLSTGCDIHFSEFKKLHANLEDSYKLTKRVVDADVIVQYICANGDFFYKDHAHEIVYVNTVRKEGSIYIIVGCAVNLFGKEFFLQYADYAFESFDFANEISNLLLGKEAINKYFIERNDYGFHIDIVHGCVRKGGYCSFCKQNYLRMPVQSMPIDEVVQIATDVTADERICKIYLSGLNTCNYGIDFGDKKPKLHLLIQKVSEIPTVKFIEVQCLTAGDMYEELIDEIANNPKVIAYGIGYQSGSNTMLKAMNVHSTIEQIQYLHDRLSHKLNTGNIMVICHPGETRETIQETLDFIQKNNLWSLQIAPYNDDIGVPSHNMEQLPKDVFFEYMNLVQEFVDQLARNTLESIIGTYIEARIASITFTEVHAFIYAEATAYHLKTLLGVYNISDNPSLLESFKKIPNGAYIKCRVSSLMDDRYFAAHAVNVFFDHMEVL